MAEQIAGFLLTRHWDDRRGAGKQKTLHLFFWLQTAAGPLRVQVTEQQAVMFIAEESMVKARQVLTDSFGLAIRTRALIPSWSEKPLSLTGFDHRPMHAIYFREQHQLFRARELLNRSDIDTLEADINPADRFLMERFITADLLLEGDVIAHDGFSEMINPRMLKSPLDLRYSPDFKVISLDIETSLSGEELYSIAWIVMDAAGEVLQRCVLMIGPEYDSGVEYLHYCGDEKELLERFVSEFLRSDPDIIIGWNVINFDLRLLQRKADQHQVALALGRGRARMDWRESRGDEQHFTLMIPGRAVLDGIDTLKSATYNFESFALDSVAQELLGRGKLTEDSDHRADEITRQFYADKPALAAYNLEDCQLVWDIFQHTHLLAFAIERARLTGLAMDRFGGSVAAFDNHYLPRLHRAGFVAPNIPVDPIGVGSPGGYVMESQPGLYQHVLVLDFKSLYPSIIRTFKIDPLARNMGHKIDPHSPHWDQRETENVDLSRLVPGYNGAVFSKEHSLLPAIIDELWEARDEAKRAKNLPLSQAIKILMNSFYGVLGTPGCRFFDYRLPSSITLRGHWILTKTRELIEAKGYQVIYGDTDSVFVWLNRDDDIDLERIESMGQTLAAELNRWWQETLERDYQLPSHLEIEYETHYSRFVMPTIRGSELGSKKRYAGVIERLDDKGVVQQHLVFKGLESVRTDWTQVARECQRELYRRIFAGEAYDEYLRQLVVDIRAGRCDAKLSYRKRIRRPLAEYTRNVPPHVQAARKAEEYLRQQARPPRYDRGGWIQYVLTVAGPEPLEYVTSALDYELYIERQIAPVADGILHFLDTDFSTVAGDQLGLFNA